MKRFTSHIHTDKDTDMFTYNKIHKSTDTLVFGYNATELNRRCLIKFRPKGSKRTILMTGRQFLEFMEGSAIVDRMIEKVQNCMSYKFTRKLRNTGEFTFFFR